MKVLIIGQGGREHAIAWKIAQSDKVKNIYVAPGNAGTSLEPKTENINIKSDNINNLLEFSKTNLIDLTIVGPEGPLVLGIVDLFRQNNLTILGPTKAAAQLEGSKAFCKKILSEANVATADYKEFSYDQTEQAKQYLYTKMPPYVIKADGLAAGKGVCIVNNIQDGLDIINNMLSGKSFGTAGQKIIIEDFLQGIEASFIALVSNDEIIPLASSQDHKARDNNDKGPNTGGMGAYSPAPIVTQQLSEQIINNIFKPTIDTLKKHNIDYNGFLYAGLMIDKNKNIKVLEYNCRLGDPETQVILPRIESDFFELCYDAARDNITKNKNISAIKWSKKTAVTVVLASKNYPSTPIKDEIINYNNHLDFRSYNNQNYNNKVFHAATYLDHNNNLRTNGGRVLAVTQLADSLQQAQNKVYDSINNISWPSMFYRTDIGYKAL